MTAGARPFLPPWEEETFVKDSGGNLEGLKWAREQDPPDEEPSKPACTAVQKQSRGRVRERERGRFSDRRRARDRRSCRGGEGLGTMLHASRG